MTDQHFSAALPYIFNETLYLVDAGVAKAEESDHVVSTKSSHSTLESHSSSSPKETTSSTPIVKNELHINAEDATDKSSVVLLHQMPSNEEKELLKKILLAVRVPFNETGVIVVSRERQITLEHLSVPQHIIFFGVSPFEFGLKDTNFPTYEVKQVNDDLLLLVSDALNKISTDPHKKKALWLALQRMFKL